MTKRGAAGLTKTAWVIRADDEDEMAEWAS
jgi:hypothetical protein